MSTDDSTRFLDDDEIDSMCASIPVGTLLTRRQRWKEGRFAPKIETYVDFDVIKEYVVISSDWADDALWCSRICLTVIRTNYTSRSDYAAPEVVGPEIGTLMLHVYCDELINDQGLAATESAAWDVVYSNP